MRASVAVAEVRLQLDAYRRPGHTTAPLQQHTPPTAHTRQSATAHQQHRRNVCARDKNNNKTLREEVLNEFFKPLKPAKILRVPLRTVQSCVRLRGSVRLFLEISQFVVVVVVVVVVVFREISGSVVVAISELRCGSSSAGSAATLKLYFIVKPETLIFGE